MSVEFSSKRTLAEFSTFGIGGPIRFFAEVKTYEEMKSGFSYASANRLPVLVVGKGSNCLFDDKGFNGVVLLNKIDFCNWKENASVHVGSGYSFSLLGSQSAKRGMSGLEFASGIPATVGGAIFMNAGANGRETCQSLQSVTYLEADGQIIEYNRKDLNFGYRLSPFQTMKGAIIAATFVLTGADINPREKQLQIIEYRKKTQPLKDKSIGCIFRNPAPNLSAGFLIEKCGLKGFTLGNAKVSEIHANFIVNIGSATSRDVQALISHIQNRVYEQTGVHLEPEVCRISCE